MQVFIERKIDAENLRRLIKQFPITLLTGPPQCGKTTLALSLKPDHHISFATDSALSDFESLYKSEKTSSGLVTLDDVEFCPEVFPRLRQLVDSRQDVRILLLGSAFLSTRTELSRNLLGRMAHYELGGFTLADVGNPLLQQHWFRGGMPPSFLSPSDAACSTWKREYLANYPHSTTFLESTGSSAHILNRLLTVLSKYNGSLVNINNFIQVLKMSRETVKRYLDILRGAGFIRLLEPFTPSRGRALRAMPKLYVRDSGLLAFLFGIERQDDFDKHKSAPMLWETYVIESMAAFVYSEFREQLRFWRDGKGTELDMVWQHKGSFVGIEVQAREEPHITPNMTAVLTDLDLSHICVIYRGSKIHKLAERILAIPITSLDAILPGPPKAKTPGYPAHPVSMFDHKRKVLVSYSHQDDQFVSLLVTALESGAVDVTVDFKSLRLGDHIDEFIKMAVRATEWTILVVSKSSIRSPWVMAEFLETVLYERFQEHSRLLPVTLDKSVFELGLSIEIDKELEVKILEVNGLIKEALKRHMDIDRFAAVRRRLLDLKNNVGNALARLNSVLVGDFSDQSQFNLNVAKLVEAIQEGK